MYVKKRKTLKQWVIFNRVELLCIFLETLYILYVVRFDNSYLDVASVDIDDF